MLTGKNLILATRQFTYEDRYRSWQNILVAMVLLIITLAITIFPIHFFLRLPFSILSGLLIVRVFVIYHDYLHKAILQKSKLADILFTIIGLYVLAPKTVWKRTHDYHHKHNSKVYKLSIGAYPVFTKEKFEACSKKEKADYLFIRSPFAILFGYVFTFIFGMCINPLIQNFKKHMDSLAALLLHFAIQGLLLYFYNWQDLLLFSLIPHFVASGIGAFLFYIQHNFPEASYSNDEEWTIELAAIESSSFLEMNPLFAWFTGNIGYHHIHHLNARIPFYKLPETMAHFKELQNPKVVKINFKEINACLRLKVWDTTLNKLIPI
jgi:omega-6 fatty acid desaturase (delta-12 desaturase)